MAVVLVYLSCCRVDFMAGKEDAWSNFFFFLLGVQEEKVHCKKTFLLDSHEEPCTCLFCSIRNKKKFPTMAVFHRMLISDSGLHCSQWCVNCCLCFLSVAQSYPDRISPLCLGGPEVAAHRVPSTFSFLPQIIKKLALSRI